MLFQGIQCDVCGLIIKVGQPAVYEDLNIPSEWFTVFQGAMIGQKPHHFCSMHCIVEFYKKSLMSEQRAHSEGEAEAVAS